jgi:glycosyltransferase involved in cell wall biosynthesis
VDDLSVDVSVVISSYNRCHLLPRALESILGQRPSGVRHELIVVDNNSTDRTRAVVEEWMARAPGRLRYVFEPRQGVSYGRNAGIASSRAPVVAFTDDDVCVAPDWIERVHQAFERNPDVGFVGGKVVPEWEAPPPAWLTREHWAPLALAHYGDEPFVCGPERPVCLLSANLAMRREVVERMGGFSPELQRVKDGIGSMEDAELQHRLHRAGVPGLYLPEMVAVSPVEAERTRRAYHRRWHAGHGRFNARMRAPEFEAASWRLFDVPAHVFRQAAAAGWVRCGVRGDVAGAFAHEVRLRFFGGFALRRWADVRAGSRRASGSPAVSPHG